MSFFRNVLKFNQARWMPIVSMAVALFCIVVLDFDFQHLIVLFIAEIILIMISAIIRMLFAYNDLVPSKTVIEKFIWLVLGLSIGAFFTVLSFMMLSNSFRSESLVNEFLGASIQITILSLGYARALYSNFFKNKWYKTAVPSNQMGSFLYVLTMLAILQAFTTHLFPNYPMLNQAKAGIVALVIIKYFVDCFFSLFQNVKE